MAMSESRLRGLGGSVNFQLIEELSKETISNEFELMMFLRPTVV